MKLIFNTILLILLKIKLMQMLNDLLFAKKTSKRNSKLGMLKNVRVGIFDSTDMIDLN